MKFNFTEREEPFFYEDFWYDLTVGGYLQPSQILSDEGQIKAVESAIKLLETFQNQAEEANIIEMY